MAASSLFVMIRHSVSGKMKNKKSPICIGVINIIGVMKNSFIPQ